MIRKLILASSLIFITTLQAVSQEEQLVVNLSMSADNSTFSFENPKGSIKVTGYDGNNIVIGASPRIRETEKTGTNSLRKIEKNPYEIYAETQGNNITLFCKSPGKTIDFDIKTPRNISIKLKSLDNGNIQVINVNGNIEVENQNGDITLDNISGSAVLNSVYGKITATFREVKPDYPMMFTSLEGDIVVNLPERISAILKMKTGSGEIYSDFDMVPVKRNSVMKNVENTKVYSLEDWTVEKINSGGPEYIFRSYNGSIYIKKNRKTGNF